MNTTFDINLEKTVLGQLLIETDCFHEISGIFFPELFYDHDNFLIAEKIISLNQSGKGVDIISVFSELNTDGKINNRLTAHYITDLTSPIASSANLVTHVLLLNEFYMKRQMVTHCRQTIKEIEESEDVFECIDAHEKRMTGIISKISISESITSEQLFQKSIERNKILIENKGISGIETGFVGLDALTGGWQKSDLIILAARPGMGKTSLALEFLRKATRKNIPGSFMSFEMPNEQIYSRLQAQETGIDLSKFLRSGLNPFELKHVVDSSDDLRNSPMIFEKMKDNFIFSIINKARKLKREKKIQFLIIDYLQLLKSGKKAFSKEQEVSEISGAMKQLARELEIPVIVLSQLSREVEKRPDKIPQLSDLRDSGSIEQDADMVIFLYRPEYYNITEDENGNSTSGKAMLLVEKHRNGACDKIQLGFIGSTTHFTN